MANITTHRTGQMQRQILLILGRHLEGLRAKEVLATLAGELPPTEYERADYPSSPGVRRFEYIARFSSIPLVKAGWLIKSGGTWTATAAGIAALEEFPEPIQLKRAADAKYREWAAARPPEDEVLETTEQEQISRITLEKAEENAWDEVTRYLGSIPPYDLQEIVAGLLRAMGNHVSYNAPPGPDQGIDLIAHTDPLGLQTPRIKVQVKRRQDRIPVDEVRSFLAILGESDAGIFLSTGGFTSEAEREARTQERRKLILIDVRRLFDLWIEHYSRIPDAQRRLLPIKPIYYLDLDQ
jgi:restriction system protein